MPTSRDIYAFRGRQFAIGSDSGSNVSTSASPCFVTSETAPIADYSPRPICWPNGVAHAWDLTSALSTSEPPWSFSTELDDSIGLGNLLLNRGESAWRDGRANDAVDDFRASAERYRRAGDVMGAAMADNNLAEILTLQLNLDAAEDLLVTARRVTEAANYPHGIMTTISGLSRIAAWRGDTARALALQQDALRGFRDLGADDFVVDSLVRLVEIHVLSGDVEAALASASDAERALRRLGAVAVLPATLARFTARALLLAGNAIEARQGFEMALKLASADEFTYEIALAEMGIGRIDGDEAGVAAALAQLAELGVVGAPPGS